MTDQFIVGNEVCNGDGDGIILGNTMFWNHLSNAGLIKGDYKATDYFSSVVPFDVKTTLPQAKMEGNVYFSFGSTYQYKNIFLLGGYPSEDWFSYNPAIKPSDAYAIDAKIDERPFN